MPATHLDFDGINDYVNCGNAPAVQISGNAITLEAPLPREMKFDEVNPRSRANPFAWFYNLKY